MLKEVCSKLEIKKKYKIKFIVFVGLLPWLLSFAYIKEPAESTYFSFYFTGLCWSLWHFFLFHFSEIAVNIKNYYLNNYDELIELFKIIKVF